jgi:hypothetical protein
MKLYHGTTPENAEIIEEELFQGSFLKELTDGFSTTGEATEGFVFCSDDRDEALTYGEALFEIEVSGDFFFQQSPMTGANEYAVPVEDVNYKFGFERFQ